MESHRQRALARVVLAGDALLVVLAMALATGLHALARRTLPGFRVPPSFDQYALLPFLTLPLFLAWIAGFRMHRLHDRAWTLAQLALGLARVHVAVFLSLAVVIFLTRSILNRSLIAAFLACTYGLMLAERALLLSWRRYQHVHGPGRERLLLVGDDGEALRAFLDLLGAEPFRPAVVGLLRPEGAAAAGEAPEGLRTLGRVADLARVLHAEAVDQVLFFPPLHRPAEAVQALDQCELLGVPASFYVELPRTSTAAPRVVTRGSFPFVTFDVAPKSAAALAVKHGIDAVAAGLGLLLLSPLLIAAALAIWATMGRPVLFVQERAGLYGRRFRMYKFRTMRRDAEREQQALRGQNEMSGPVFKIARDPRITRLGHLLRRTSIDELPQLFNVLLGQMSLVGPRPLPLQEQQAIVGWQRRRLSMKPGLTGLWQVSGRSGIDFEHWMRLDLEYIDRWSLALDLQLLLRTIPAVFLARGAR
ncbi:MAG: exopolysaccharide biosynthesis polyprenyl glycosylphosphotransferase [Deltaproteobacteria bacterium]|nr:exopolysaccharide biosynthesis polyprenyl glycosylphosphotransferase [Deltaproteobacteria bacterium]